MMGEEAIGMNTGASMFLSGLERLLGTDCTLWLLIVQGEEGMAPGAKRKTSSFSWLT